jgi:hypothetical protein
MRIGLSGYVSAAAAPADKMPSAQAATLAKRWRDTMADA